MSWAAKRENPDRQIEIFITRKGAANLVREEEERVVLRMKAIDCGRSMNGTLPLPAHVEYEGLSECARRLRSVRSRLEDLVE